MYTISEVRIKDVERNDGLVGLASCVINNDFRINSIGIYAKLSGGYRITYPTKDIDGAKLNLIYPISKSFANWLEVEILKQYQDMKLYGGHD